MCFNGPARTAAHEMWCTTATSTTTTSTVPMRPPTSFDGPVRAVAHEMCCTAATPTTFFRVPGSLSAKNSNTYLIRPYDAFLANRLGSVFEYDALCKCRIKALAPLWVYRRHSLPSRRRTQHDVLALVRPADGTAGSTASRRPRQGASSDRELQRRFMCFDVEPGMRTAAAIYAAAPPSIEQR